MDSATFFADVGEFASASPINIMLMVGFVGLLILLISNEITRITRGVKEIIPAKVVQIMNQGGTVVDVRSSTEYDKTHIVNAKNIPLAQLDKKQSQLDKDASIVLYCGTGNDAIKAATQLKKAGFANIYTLKNGLPSWQEDKMPVVNAKKNQDKKNQNKKKNKKKKATTEQ